MKNEKRIFIVIILMLTIAVPLVPLSTDFSAEAQLAPIQPTVNIPTGVTPNRMVNTIAHISFRPDPVGIGQPLLINMWMQFETFDRHKKYVDSFKLTITDPDGKSEVYIMDSYPCRCNNVERNYTKQIRELDTCCLNFLETISLQDDTLKATS